MSGYLLDTHTLLWFETDPARLSPGVLNQLKAFKEPVFVSAINLWELGIKFKAGKLPEAGPLVTNWFALVARLEVGDLGFSSVHSGEAASLDWEHKDPFDRALAAQARVEGLTLVTRDPAFSALPRLKTLW